MSTDHTRAAHAARALKENTSVLDHELVALTKAGVLAEHSIDSLFMLLGRVDVLNAALHRTLVEWHSQFPQKATLQESDRFWADLKELRSTNEQLTFLLNTIEEHEQKMNTLKHQLRSTQHSIGAIERYFDAYLNRVTSDSTRSHRD